jgi:hypothetical protein
MPVETIPPITVLVETSPKRVFTAALEWPGWVRSGRDEDAALAALAAYAPRFAPVAVAAGWPLPGDGVALEYRVEGRVEGNATTAFGAPDACGTADRRSVDEADARRLASLVTAAWTALDDVVARAPAELRKGPRGGGRDRDRVVSHVLGSEKSYARTIGLRLSEADPADPSTVAAQRAAILAVLGAPSDGSPLAGGKWPLRYAARRIAWHVLDHAWEIGDRAEPA